MPESAPRGRFPGDHRRARHRALGGSTHLPVADLVDDTAPAALRTVRNVPPDPARSRWDDYAGWTPPTTEETFTTPRHACSCARMNKDAVAFGGVIWITAVVGQVPGPEDTSL